MKELQSEQNSEPIQHSQDDARAAGAPAAPDVKSRLDLLEQLHGHFVRCAHIPAELEEPITQAFGADFWKMLAEWEPVNHQVSILAQRRE